MDADAGETESPEEDAAEGGEEGEVLKNHLYLPGDFPGDKAPKPGDKKAFMTDATFVEIKKGEQCWKVDDVDGVPISSEGEEENAQMGDENESTTSEASAPDEGSEPPEPPGAGGGENPATAIILGKRK
jgi:hypothetical protein